MYGILFASVCTVCNFQWRMAMSICPSLKLAVPLLFAVLELDQNSSRWIYMEG
jgi:hypothetical protein